MSHIKPLHWLLAGLIFFLAMVLEPYVFPSLNIGLNTDQQTVLHQAQQQLHDHAPDWAPERHSVRLTTNEQTQYFLEQSLDHDALQQQLHTKQLNYTYWEARFFTPQQRSISYYYHPDGTLMGFQDNDLNETHNTSEPLSQPSAVDLAMATIEHHTKHRDLKLIAYHHKENTASTHTITFELPHSSLPKDSYPTITVTIKGHDVVALKPSLHIPSTFKERFQAQQQFKQRIQIMAMLASIILLSTGIISSIWVYRRSFVSFKQAVAFGGLWSGLNTLYALNLWPLAWSQVSLFQPELEITTQLILGVIGQAAFGFIIGLVGYLIAECIYRGSTPGKLSIASYCRPQLFTHLTVRYQCHLAYLLCAFLFGFMTLYYLVGIHIFNFYLPSQIPFNFDMITTPAPWLISLLHALQASLSEEVLYRIIPIGTTLLFLDRKHPALHSVIILQAVIWALMHIGYPTEPYYARIIELTAVGLIFGYTYLRHGIFTVVLIHFLFDFILMSMPLFYASGWLAHCHQFIAVVLALLPLLLCHFGPKHRPMDQDDINPRLMSSPQPQISEKALAYYHPSIIQRWAQPFLITGALITLALLWQMTFKHHSPVISATEAVDIASQHMQQVTQTDPKSWTIIPIKKQESDYIYLVNERPNYFLPYHYIQYRLNDQQKPTIEPYLYPNGWHITFRRFNQDEPILNTSHFYAIIDDHGHIFEWFYHIPDSTTLGELSTETAESSLKTLLDKRHIQDWSWYERSTTKHAGFDTYLMLASNHQAKTPLFQGLDGMIYSGDQPTAALKRLLIDPQAADDFQSLSFSHLIMQLMQSAAGATALLTPILLACIALAKRHLSWQLIKPWWLLLSAVQILNTLNQAPIALLNLSPQAQPALDLPIHLLYSLWLPLIQAFLYAVLIGWTLSHPRVMSHTRHATLVALTAIILGLWLLCGQVLSSEHANMPYSLSTAYPLVGSFLTPIPQTLLTLTISLLLGRWFSSKPLHLFGLPIFLSLMIYPDVYALSFDGYLTMAYVAFLSALAIIWVGVFSRYDERLLLLVGVGYLMLPYLTSTHSTLWPYTLASISAIWLTALAFMRTFHHCDATH